jgi:hypothetical protein
VLTGSGQSKRCTEPLAPSRRLEDGESEEVPGYSCFLRDGAAQARRQLAMVTMCWQGFR